MYLRRGVFPRLTLLSCSLPPSSPALSFHFRGRDGCVIFFSTSYPGERFVRGLGKFLPTARSTCGNKVKRLGSEQARWLNNKLSLLLGVRCTAVHDLLAHDERCFGDGFCSVIVVFAYWLCWHAVGMLLALDPAEVEGVAVLVIVSSFLSVFVYGMKRVSTILG